MNGKDVLFMKSIKKKNKVGSDSTSMTEDDVWDDSVLVEAYNKAVDHAHTKVLKNMPSIPLKTKMGFDKGDHKKQWKLGDYCRCEFTENHTYYEAVIIDIINDLDMCIVKYVGYENEEKVPLNKIKPSKGEMARSIQKNKALKEKGVMGGPSIGKQQPGSGNLPQPGKKNVPKKPEDAKGKETASANNKNSERPTSNMFKQPVVDALPPPPPPHMFNKLGENGPESDAMSAMLMSWYLSGYHTGYYQGLKATKK